MAGLEQIEWRTSEQPVPYREALAALDLGDVLISEVFDPSFGPDQNVAMVRIQAQDDVEVTGVSVTITDDDEARP